MASMPSFTKKYYKVSYPAIDPARPELEHGGKTVLITGAGTGIGAAAAAAYATAGASHLILTGRRLELLNQTKSQLASSHPSTRVSVASVDVTDPTAVASFFTTIPTVDVLINCAGYLSDKGTIASSPVAEFWAAMEINVKGAYNLAQKFLNQQRPKDSDPVMIGMNTLLAHFPATAVTTAPASYACSKLAAGKLMEYVASENHNVRAYSLQPGVIKTDMSLKSLAMDPGNPYADWDAVEIAAHFTVWLSSKEGKEVVPSGRFLWSNWDVDELKARKQELWSSNVELTISLPGWPFPAAEETCR